MRGEDWKIGRLEDWKIGRLEDWKIGRLEDWKIGVGVGWGVLGWGEWCVGVRMRGAGDVLSVRNVGVDLSVGDGNWEKNLEVDLE